MFYIILYLHLLSMARALDECHDNCVKVDGLMYRLYNETHHWQDAQDVCQIRQGRLARDTNDVIHKAITGLLQNAGVTSAWLGATTGPLYWNWIIPYENIASYDHRPMYFQGCFNAGNNMRENCKNQVTYVGNCLEQCRFYNYSTVYKDGGSKQICCCGNAFGMKGAADPGRCQSCTGIPRCGENSNTNAIYSTKANPVDLTKIRWRNSYPTSLDDGRNHGLCTMAHGTRQYPKLKHRQCTERLQAMCMLENTGSHGECLTRMGTDTEYPMKETGKCLKVLQDKTTWEESILQCEAEDTSRQSQLMSLHDPGVYRDVEHAFRTNLQLLSLDLWVFGSSNRWIWTTGPTSAEKEDVMSSHWSTREDRLPIHNKCLKINNHGNWTAMPCDQNPSPYVCESSENPISTSYVTRPSAQPDNPTGGSGNIAAVIGGTLGALLVVILIIVGMLIWWIKFRRNPGTKNNQQPRKNLTGNGKVKSKGAGQPIEPHIYETLDENVGTGRTPRMGVSPPKPPRLQADDRPYEDVNDLPGFQPQRKGSHDNRAYESVEDTVGNVPCIIKDHVSPGRTSRSNMADLVEKDRMNKVQAVVTTTEEGSQGDSKPKGKPDIGRKPVTGRKVETTDDGLPETQQPKQGRKSIDSASHDTYAKPNKDKKTPKGVTEANVGQNGEQAPMYLELISDEPLEPPGDDGEIVMVENEIYNS